MVELRVSSVDATMYIQGLNDMLPRNAPTAAIKMLSVRSFFAPNLSEKNPVGTENRSWQREGMATMRPICWFVRANSSLRTGKRVDRMFPAAWTRACMRTMIRRLMLIRLVFSCAVSSSMLDHLDVFSMRPMLPFYF